MREKEMNRTEELEKEIKDWEVIEATHGENKEVSICKMEIYARQYMIGGIKIGRQEKEEELLGIVEKYFKSHYKKETKRVKLPIPSELQGHVSDVGEQITQTYTLIAPELLQELKQKIRGRGE